MRLAGILVAGLLASWSVEAEPVVSPGGRLVFWPGPGAESLATELASAADDDRRSVVSEVGRDFDEVVDVHVSLDARSYRESLPAGAAVPVWSQGAAFPADNRIMMVGRDVATLRAMLRARLGLVVMAHVSPGAFPRWFLEGLAMLNSGDRWLAEGPDLTAAASAGNLMRFATLGREFPSEADEVQLAFAQSADFVAWLAARRRGGPLQSLVRSVAAGVPFDAAAATHLGAPVRELEQRWSTGLVRWEVLGRMFAESPAWWAVFGMALAYAAVRWRASRRERKLEAARASVTASTPRFEEHVFALIPAIWADIPAPVDPTPHKDDLEPPSSDRDAATVSGEEVDETHSRLAAAAQPRKPTLH